MLRHQLWVLECQLCYLDELQVVGRSGAKKWALERPLRDRVLRVLGGWMLEHQELPARALDVRVKF